MRSEPVRAAAAVPRDVLRLAGLTPVEGPGVRITIRDAAVRGDEQAPRERSDREEQHRRV